MPLKFWTLTKCHTEARRGRRINKTKQWKARRYLRCIERRSLFANSISNLYTKRLSRNSYQESVPYPSVALCAIAFNSVHSVTLCAILYERLSLSVHITGGANTEVYKIVYKKRDYLRKGNPVKIL